MTRLNWAAPGARYFENGVDRGVLFVGTDTGVPWTGLISVAETPTGGEARAFYQDGVKYLNISAREEYEATISAFSAPPEFGVCDGVALLHNGLFVTQQPRKPFGFSYRTMIGNDTEGQQHGYKIHLVYNALAAPSQRNNASLGSDVDPDTLSWQVTTRPPALTGRRPTAHFVIDSRFTPPDLMTALEDWIYGNEYYESSMPSVEDLINLFASEGPTRRYNYVQDPQNTTHTKWIALGTGTVKSTDTAIKYGGTSSTKVVAGPSAPDATYGWAVYLTPMSDPDFEVGTKLEWRTKLYSPTTQTVKVWPVVNSGWSEVREVFLVAGEWQEVVIPVTISVATTNFYMIIGTTTPNGVFYIDETSIGEPGPYFDGSKPNADGYFYYWFEPVNNSTSFVNSWKSN